jgi:NAD(P)-dependent dehydrogenase (short-subunit alcohol dehydrogenase family)
MNNQESVKDIFNLAGKVVVITGATGLLGRRHAEAIAAYGGTPVLLDLFKESIDSLAEELNAKFQTRATGFSVDITQEQAVSETCQRVEDAYGRVDVLINNAANNPKVDATSSVANTSRLENFPMESWNQDIAVGLTGSFLCSRYFGQSIVKSGGGSIINISSDLGVIAPDHRLYSKDGVAEHLQSVKPVTYSVVKTGLIGLTRYLATYWANKGVRCNALCPGGVFNGQGEAFVQRVSSLIPLGRMAKIDEYQGAIVFLSSDASTYMNGAVLIMDGGRSTW